MKRFIASVISIGALGAVLIFATMSVALAGGRPLSTILSGVNEIPGPGDPDGSGLIDLTVNQGLGEVCYYLNVENITLPATGAHIHNGISSVAGPVLIGLTAPDSTGVSSDCISVDKDLIKEIRQTPENYYVNVHTQDYPAGAIRGQLEK